MNDLKEEIQCDHNIIYQKKWFGIFPSYKLGRCSKCNKIFKKYKDHIEEVIKEKDEW